jgi:hypothetical protein
MAGQYCETEVATAVAGARMFLVQQSSVAGGGASETVEMMAAEGTQVFYKTYAGLKTPFGLPLEFFPSYEKLLDKDPTLVSAVNIMMRGAVSQATAAQYKPVLLQFHRFCSEHGYVFPYFEPDSVLHFAAAAQQARKPLGFFRRILPALGLLESVSDRTGTGVTKTVRDAIDAIERNFADTKPAVRKAKGYAYEVIDHLLRVEVAPHMKQPYRINVFHFRALFRAIVIYFTFCRYEDFSRLTDKEFQDGGTYIKITFLKRKNDQYGDNSVHVIPVREDVSVCPVAVIRAYFWRFGLVFQGTGNPVNFRIRRDGGAFFATRYKLSRGTATKCTRQLLAKHGYEAADFTEKSLKVGGVTSLLDAGESLENVQVLGGWKSLQTPLHYRNASLKFKLGIASRIPVKADGDLKSVRDAQAGGAAGPTAASGGSNGDQ